MYGQGLILLVYQDFLQLMGKIRTEIKKWLKIIDNAQVNKYKWLIKILAKISIFGNQRNAD